LRLQRSPDPLAAVERPTSKGRGKEGRGEKGRGGGAKMIYALGARNLRAATDVYSKKHNEKYKTY